MHHNLVFAVTRPMTKFGHKLEHLLNGSLLIEAATNDRDKVMKAIELNCSATNGVGDGLSKLISLQIIGINLRI